MSLYPKIQRLITIESCIHYGEPPPPTMPPFVCVEHDSPILVSAPHGTRAFRNNDKEVWHEEDEYTAGMALLLAERCKVSAIANIWRSDECDPNHHGEERCPYKKTMQDLVRRKKVRWVLDLHGAAEDSKDMYKSVVAVGTRDKNSPSLPHEDRDHLKSLIESEFGAGAVSLTAFQAKGEGTVTAFCQATLKIQAIQIEMKPSVRVPLRRTDASAFAKHGPYEALPFSVFRMLYALEQFIDHLRHA